MAAHSYQNPMPGDVRMLAHLFSQHLARASRQRHSINVSQETLLGTLWLFGHTGVYSMPIWCVH